MGLRKCMSCQAMTLAFHHFNPRSFHTTTAFLSPPSTAWWSRLFLMGAMQLRQIFPLAACWIDLSRLVDVWRWRVLDLRGCGSRTLCDHHPLPQPAAADDDARALAMRRSRVNHPSVPGFCSWLLSFSGLISSVNKSSHGPFKSISPHASADTPEPRRPTKRRGHNLPPVTQSGRSVNRPFDLPSFWNPKETGHLLPTHRRRSNRQGQMRGNANQRTGRATIPNAV